MQKGSQGVTAAVMMALCRILCPDSRYTVRDSVALVRERTIPTERPPLVGEISANVFG
jgi:hypothetical protein